MNNTAHLYAVPPTELQHVDPVARFLGHHGDWMYSELLGDARKREGERRAAYDAAVDRLEAARTASGVYHGCLRFHPFTPGPAPTLKEWRDSVFLESGFGYRTFPR